jgi:hypothetical protein
MHASMLAFVSLMIISSASSRFVSNNKVSSTSSFFNSLLLVHPQVNLLKQQVTKEGEREREREEEPISLCFFEVYWNCGCLLSLSLLSLCGQFNGKFCFADRKMRRFWLECRCCCTGNHGGHSGCTCTTSAGSTGLCDNTHHGLFPC